MDNNVYHGDGVRPYANFIFNVFIRSEKYVALINNPSFRKLCILEQHMVNGLYAIIMGIMLFTRLHPTIE